MKRSTERPDLTFLLAGLIASFAALPVLSQGKLERGVYEYVIRKCTMDIDGATAALEEKIQGRSLRLIAKYDQAAPEKCSFRTRVFILYDPEYA